ncbi:MAG: phosphoribosylaminoimidazolesuccinocarboxamide synthase [Chitinophagaceae bacterium]
MQKKEYLYEGKDKQIYATDELDKIIIYYKDVATAFNGVKKAIIANKGVLNNKITELLFNKLEKEGIPTHFIKHLSEREQLCKKVTIFPLEVIVRNVITGSMAKRLNLEEGIQPINTIFELYYNND